jgi:hypothetical protein
MRWCWNCDANLFGLDPPAPVSHRLDQLADLLVGFLIAHIGLLVEESGSVWQQHLQVGDDDRDSWSLSDMDSLLLERLEQLASMAFVPL